MHKLDIVGVSKSFSRAEVLKKVDFFVEDGEFLSILGPSGCGKTTLLRLLLGLESPDFGSIFKDGTDITTYKPSRRQMGVVFQNYALFENMTALENVAYALRINKTTRKFAEDKALRMLEIVGLTSHKDKKPSSLSGGQQQRVAIARTLALNPEVILFDEPMSALDVSTRLLLRDEIKRIQKDFGTTIIYITHDQEEALTMSDRIMVMSEGEIVQIGTPQEIVQSPCNEYVEKFVVNNIKSKVDALTRHFK